MKVFRRILIVSVVDVQGLPACFASSNQFWMAALLGVFDAPLLELIQAVSDLQKTRHLMHC
jgi:hypothetical protein